MRKHCSGTAADVDGGAAPGGQLFVAGDEIRVQVGLEDVTDADALLLRRLQVNLDIALRIDDHRLAFGGQQVRGMGQASQVELLKVHGYSRAQIAIGISGLDPHSFTLYTSYTS